MYFIHKNTKIKRNYEEILYIPIFILELYSLRIRGLSLAN